MHDREVSRFHALFFAGFTLISILCISFAWIFESYFLLAVPAGVLIAGLGFVDIRKLFYFFVFCIPFSIEFDVSQTLRTDLPTEPLLAGLMVLTLLLLGSKPELFQWRFFKNPVVVVIGIQFLWVLLSSIQSIQPDLSAKYILAKMWYLVPLVVLASVQLKEVKDFKLLFWLFLIPLIPEVIITLIRYYPLGFAFEEVNKTMTPYFRNKVVYGTFLTLFLPFLFIATSWYEKGSWKWYIIQFSKPLFLAGIYFSYTRSCVLALLIAGVAWLAMRMRLLVPTYILGLVFIGGLVVYLAHDNEFLDYAPVYEKTVQHDNYDEHLAATVSMEDASSMERIYMWLGGIYMFFERPVFGSGPNTFYPAYKSYTIKSFETYLSDNDEHLTIHNYYLLTLLEQGAVGLSILLLLLGLVLFYAQKAWHALNSKAEKNIVMATTLSFIIIVVSLALSDLVETDKIGSVYFLEITLIVNLFLKSRQQTIETSLSA